MRITGYSTPHVADSRQSIKQFEADLERQLLAGEGVDEGLENRGKSWRVNALKTRGERPEPRVAGGHSIPPGQINANTEQPIDDPSDALAAQPVPRRRRRRHHQAGLDRWPRLSNDDFGWPSAEPNDAPVAGAIPPIYHIARSSPQRPGGQVESKRRNRSDDERKRWPRAMASHRVDRRRGRSAAAARGERCIFASRYSRNATALLCSVSWEL